MLAKLLEADPTAHRQLVVALVSGGSLRSRVAATGAEVRDLGLVAGELNPFAIVRLARLISRWRPALVHGWMYHGNLAALLATRCLGRRIPLVWNIRHSLHDPANEKRMTRAVIRASAPLSRFADAVVYNSGAGARQHEAFGYSSARTEVIPNGFDPGRFRPDPAARARLRGTLGLDETTGVIGLVARYHPTKDHGTLILAAAALAAAGLDLFLVMLGENVTPHNGELAGAIAAAGLTRRVALLGERTDVAQVVPAFDVAVLSSRGEGFPNVLGEAMACGVPCVATDVGDCRFLLADCGEVVPPGDPPALAAALRAMLQLPLEQRVARGAAGRARIEQHFTMPVVARRYRALYERVAGSSEKRA
jgi:glycosyltransferase involved in cell wall biosynthesis